MPELVSLDTHDSRWTIARGGEPRAGRPVDLAVVVNGFPRLSETFVLQELLELERHGLRLHVIALRNPDETIRQLATERLRAGVEYLPLLGERSPRLAVRAAHAALALRRPTTYLNGLAEIIASPDFSRTNLRRAVLLAHRLVRLGAPPIYVHFAHKPATLARYASLLTGSPYALSAHAKDIWTTPDPELARKVRDAAVVLTCTAEGKRHLDSLAGGRTAVRLVYHGVATERAARPRQVTSPPIVLSVGRLVEKKGHDVVLRAAAKVKQAGHAFRLRIAGEGLEWPKLQRLVHELGLTDEVSFLGPLDEDELADEYDRAAIFALAPRELENGDRDGIPNVLLEAMAHGLAIASTSGTGVQEAVTHDVSALLASPFDVDEFAANLQRLITDPALRERLARRARDRVHEVFDRDANLPGVLSALGAAGFIPERASAPLPDDADDAESVEEVA